MFAGNTACQQQIRPRVQRRIVNSGHRHAFLSIPDECFPVVQRHKQVVVRRFYSGYPHADSFCPHDIAQLKKVQVLMTVQETFIGRKAWHVHRISRLGNITFQRIEPI